MVDLKKLKAQIARMNAHGSQALLLDYAEDWLDVIPKLVARLEEALLVEDMCYSDLDALAYLSGRNTELENQAVTLRLRANDAHNQMVRWREQCHLLEARLEEQLGMEDYNYWENEPDTDWRD